MNLPAFIGELRERLQSSESWQNDPLRIVPAPKSQRWRLRERVWEPIEKGATSARLRPLAHVSLADQVVATALMLCLADRVETVQGDPRRTVRDQESRRQVVSYGNRLFCDAIGGELRHRWGSAKLYRAYYEDYRTFISRPEVAAESISETGGERVYVVHADLRQFYDRVRPDLLAEAIGRLHGEDNDPAFFALATSVLDWGWHSRDERDVRIYAEQAELEDFTRVALPQGLVGSGFFANTVLLPLDEALRTAIGTEIAPGMLLADACRYVDDFRILVAVAPNSDGSLNDLEKMAATWLSQVLDDNATGLALSPEKIQIAALGGEERPLVRQGAKMSRIQSAVSGGFDALGGEEILDAIQGLMRAQEALSVGDDSGWRLSPVPDVRDDTVARFGAARYRMTYLRQQALLFLAACDPARAPVTRTGSGPETQHYRELIRFLRGEGERLRSSDFATLAILARRAFVDRTRAAELTRPGLNPSRKRQLAQRDPSFLLELSDMEVDAHFFDDLPSRIREDLGRVSESSEGDHDTLSKTVLKADPSGSLRNELSLLQFAIAFLEQWEQQESPPEVITPGQVTLNLDENQAVAGVAGVSILRSRSDAAGSLYQVAGWCQASERWRFQLGFLLRFILSGEPDFTRPVRRTGWKETESCYRPAESHWYQRLYGLYNGQPAFGDDWLPITDWVAGFLLALLRWPGCRAPEEFRWVEEGIEVARTQVGERIADLQQWRGNATGALILPLLARRPTATDVERPLRACVVQTAIPAFDDFRRTDLQLDGSVIRRKHRNHLSAALAAVERMLALRETHKGSEGGLDWLILPELAVHPRDVHTHLVPFARFHKAIVLTGLTMRRFERGNRSSTPPYGSFRSGRTPMGCRSGLADRGKLISRRMNKRSMLVVRTSFADSAPADG